MATLDFSLNERRSSHPSAVISRETNWGVVVTEVPYSAKTVSLAETSLKIFGLFVALGGGITPFLALPIITKIGFALAFVFVGYSIYRYASHGFRTELRIDTRLGDVLVGKVDAKGDFSEKRAFSKASVESFYIKRSKSGPAKLCMRLKKNAQQIVLFQADENDLLAPFERIVGALYVKKGSGRRVKTRANDQFIHATFA